jgi:hypothetical protein
LQTPVASKQAPGGVEQSTGAPATQAPLASQEATPLQAFPSSQLVPTATGTWVTAPVAASQASTVHGLLSSTGTGVPGTQAPLPLQVSVVVQAFPSSHPVPAGASW